MNSVLFSHPHAKHDAQGFAAALEAAGILGQFVTGIAVTPDSFQGAVISRISRLAPYVSNRLMDGVDRDRIRCLGAVELGARALGRLGGLLRIPRLSGYNCMYVGHDLAVAALPWPRGTDGVYAYEDGALHTFRRAARRDIPRLWDLPLPHYKAVERMYAQEAARWPGASGAMPRVEPAWKQRRKDVELQLATHVSAASRFTRESLQAIGCNLPVLVTPYGFPVEQFAAKERIADGPFTVLAVGSHSLRKGTPYLLEAWKRADLKDARLRLIGPMQLAPDYLAAYHGWFDHVPHLPKSQLGTEYRAADVVAFPTLCDGFGLVIQESMCCGTPVITTRCGGGPECIDDGRTGWILAERNVDALVECLRETAGDRQATFRVGRAARARAETYTWREAGRALADKLSRI